MKNLSLLAMAFIALCGVGGLHAAPAIRHAFLAIDEGLAQLLHIDERDPTKNWIVPTGHPQARDMQLVGGGRVLIGHHEGYTEFEIATGKVAKDVIGYKGVVITLGKDANAFVCYDTELVRMSLGWVTNGKRFGLTVPRFNAPPPQVNGTPIFGTAKVPGWASDGVFADPRKDKRGPLPREWAHHKGIYVHGKQVVLHYSVGAVDVLELPGFERVEQWPVFTRTFQTAVNATDLALTVLP